MSFKEIVGVTVDRTKRHNRIWGGESPRIFLSHSANNKVLARAVKTALEYSRMSAFVAHEDIEPTSAWQEEIEFALTTMDILVALLTESFRGSNWTEQEVGFALGQGKPVIPVSIEIDPFGMMGKYQALSARGRSGADIGKMVAKFFMTHSWPDQRLESMQKDNYIANLAYADSYEETNDLAKLLDQFDSFTAEQADEFTKVFNSNTQVHGAHGFDSSIAHTLTELSGVEYELLNPGSYRHGDRQIRRVRRPVPTASANEDGLPF